jgi:hypothetical protein
MTNLAVFQCHLPLDVLPTCCLHMGPAGAMAHLTTGIFEMRGFFDTDKSSGFAISCGMTDIAAFYFFCSQSLFYPLDAVVGFTFLRILHETVIFLFMTVLADIRSDIDGNAFCLNKIWRDSWKKKKEEAEKRRDAEHAPFESIAQCFHDAIFSFIKKKFATGL